MRFLARDCGIATSWRPFRAPTKYIFVTRGVAPGCQPPALSAPGPWTNGSMIQVKLIHFFPNVKLARSSLMRFRSAGSEVAMRRSARRGDDLMPAYRHCTNYWLIVNLSRGEIVRGNGVELGRHLWEST